MLSSAGRLPKPGRARKTDVANTALSRSVRNSFQIGSGMVVLPPELPTGGADPLRTKVLFYNWRRTWNFIFTFVLGAVRSTASRRMAPNAASVAILRDARQNALLRTRCQQSFTGLWVRSIRRTPASALF